MNKNKILNAINEGIKSGFKIKHDLIIDNSSDIDFNNTKINNVKSLNIE